MEFALSDENIENVEETLMSGLYLAEEILLRFENAKIRQLTTLLLRVTKLCIRTLHSDLKPCKLLKESLDILQDGFECVGTDNAGRFLPFRVTAMKMALYHGNYDTFKNGLTQVEETFRAFTDSDTKNITSSLIRIVKFAVCALQTNENPFEFLKKNVEVIHNTFEYICNENRGYALHLSHRR
jgi:hypothetical protein